MEHGCPSSQQAQARWSLSPSMWTTHRPGRAAWQVLQIPSLESWTRLCRTKWAKPSKSKWGQNSGRLRMQWWAGAAPISARIACCTCAVLFQAMYQRKCSAWFRNISTLSGRKVWCCLQQLQARLLKSGSTVVPVTSSRSSIPATSQLIQGCGKQGRQWFGVLGNLDETYDFLTAFGLLSEEGNKSSKANSKVNPHQSALNNLLQFGSAARATRTSGSYGDTSGNGISLGVVGNMHPSTYVPMERSETGSHHAATKERFLICSGRPIQPHEDLPKDYPLPSGEASVATWLGCEETICPLCVC